MLKCLFYIMLFMSCSAWAQPSITWHKLSMFPSSAREGFGYFVIDSNFYVVGGVDSSLHNHSEVWKYNIPTNQWFQMDTFLGGVMEASNGFTLNGKGYICTGLLPDSNHNVFCSSDFYEYNPLTDIWIKKPNFPGIYREGATAFTYNGKAYLGLGYACGQPLNDLWEYDPVTDHWTQKDFLPASARFNTTVSVVDSFAYFIGGELFNYGFSLEQWRYDIRNNIWDKMSDFPSVDTGICGTINFALNQSFIAGCGSTGGSNFASKFQLFSTTNNQWRSIESIGFIDSTAGGASFIWNSKAYFFAGYRLGGTSFAFYKDMWTFDATEIMNYTGINNLSDYDNLKVYPNPISTNTSFCVSSAHSGEINFSNSLGQIVFTSKIVKGNNFFSSDQMNISESVIFYSAVLQNGATLSGKIVATQ